ncbi:MAG: DUF554 domain-containing protein [Saprospiraceae bacterium]
MKTLPIATFINAVAIIIGSLIGLVLQQSFTEGIETIVFQAVGLGTILIGIKMALKLPEGYLLIFIFSLVFGGIFGELIHLDKIILGLSDNLKTLLHISEASFSEGLITAFLLFCIGSMTIVGAIEEGINNNKELILVKSTLDGFTSIALTASLGIGVIFSVIPLLIFQGGLTLLAKRLRYFFDQSTIDSISAVGGILIIAISINILKLGTIKLENLLPSLLIIVILSKVSNKYSILGVDNNQESVEA